MRYLTYKYRLLPTKRQHKALEQILEDQRHLYNAALQERIGFYNKTGKSRSYFGQVRQLTQCRLEMPEMAQIPLNIQRGTLKRLDTAFQGFFSRRKKGEKAGYPRFRGENGLNSFDFVEFRGIRLIGNRLKFIGLPGTLRVHFHRKIPKEKITGVKFKREIKGWYVFFQIQMEDIPKKVVVSSVGIDVGLKALVATSDGLIIPNPKIAKKAEKQIRKIQRKLSRCKKESHRRKKIKRSLGRMNKRLSDRRTTNLHQISRMIVNQYDLISVEDLNIKFLLKGNLSANVNDASWTKFLSLLRYKAEGAGAHFIEVDPKYTSQTCPVCGHIQRKELSQRMHNCVCGYIADRDVAAAQVILQRAVAGAEWLKTRHQPVSATGNINHSTRMI